MSLKSKNELLEVVRPRYLKANKLEKQKILAEVTIGLKDGKTFSLSVRDHGRGISKENQEHVFEPFFTTGKSVGGTGLGLSIIHNIVVNMLDGGIKLNSTEGKGTEFIVTFPREIA